MSIPYFFQVSLWELIKTGGWTMAPLAVCSLAVWAVIVERLWALRDWRGRNREFLLSFSNLWLKRDLEGARKLCERTPVDMAVVALEFFSDPDAKGAARSSDEDRVLARVDRRRLERSSELRRFLWILGTIGSASPFIGLFGTVVGIIRSFTSMAEAGAGGFAVVAGGISEALVATAAGILVAVIAVFFYNYLQVKVGDLQFQLKLLCEEMLELRQEDQA